MKVYAKSTVSESFTPFSVRWIPNSARICVLGVDPTGDPNQRGVIEIRKVVRGRHIRLQSRIRVRPALRCGVFTGSFPLRHLATGSYNGSVDLWDMNHLSALSATSSTASTEQTSNHKGTKKNAPVDNTMMDTTDKPVRSIQGAHQGIINAIHGCWTGEKGETNESSGLLATAGRDGMVKLWDLRANQPLVASIAHEKVSRAAKASVSSSSTSSSSSSSSSFDSLSDVWAVCFDQNQVLASGDDEGIVRIFDMRKIEEISTTYSLGSGVTSISFQGGIRSNTSFMCASTTGGGTAVIQHQRGQGSKSRDLMWVHKDAGQTTWLGLLSPHWTSTSVKSASADATSEPQLSNVLVTSNSKGMMHSFHLSVTAHKTKRVMTSCKAVLKNKTTFSRDLAVISAEWHPERQGLIATAGLDKMVRVILL